MAKDNPKYLSLENIGKGVLLEKFDDAMQDVLRNIDDPNCSLKTKRKISIEMVITPMGKGNAGTYTVEVKTKLAAPRKHEGTITIGRLKGDAGYVASEVDLDQEELEFGDNITEMKGDSKC